MHGYVNLSNVEICSYAHIISKEKNREIEIKDLKVYSGSFAEEYISGKSYLKNWTLFLKNIKKNP